jgi:NAD(P)-dependent dehydrogenase (short-subunit alcohol dehydrogenase family)
MSTKQSTRYEGRVAVVTGGGSGIGAAVVRRLIAEGAQVVAGDLDGQSVQRLEADHDGAVIGVEADVSDEQQVDRLVSTAVERFGRLDAGFNVAGIGGAGELLAQELAGWNRVLAVCLTGVMLAMRAEAAQMVRQGGGGAIVNVASVNSEIPMRGGAAYCVAKAGAAMLSQVGALEFGEHSIRVNTVSPGLTATPLTAPVIAVDAARSAYLERIPLGSVGTPEQMASAALYLASDDADYVSGVNFAVDGAWRTTGYPDLRAALGR